MAFALIVFFAGRWMFDKLNSGILAAGGTILLFLSVPLLHVSRYMWTEMLFILFLLLFYIEFERYLQKGRFGSLVLAAVFSALVCTARYAGVTVVAAAALFLLFTKKSILKKITDIAFYGALSVLPMGIWVLRNYMVSGTLLGVRLPSTYTLRQNIDRTLKSVYTWVQPDKLLTQNINGTLLYVLKSFAVLLPLALACAFAVVLVRSLVDYNPLRKLSWERSSGSELSSESERLLPILFFVAYSAIYIVYLIASATLVAFEPINNRYLAPVYLPVLLSLFIAADYLHERIKARINPKLAGFFTYALLALFLIYPALNSAAFTVNNRRIGAGGFASDVWHERDGFIKYMDYSGRYTYYSNCADAVYVLTGIRTYCIPKRSGPYMYGLEQFKAAVSRDENSYIIWFDSGVPPTLYNLEDIAGMYVLEESGSFGYGNVYRIAAPR
ncbi:MAG: hypothetical protein GXY17_12755 [Clostridiaceae bacterium]|nr:hypothetical protein [Clostridiaceae bacterium]